MIVRVFRVTVNDGKQADFEQFFRQTAAPHVRSQPGLISLQMGRPLPSTPDEFVMVMLWKNLDAVKSFAGTGWQQAVILEQERDLIREVSVHHYEAMDEGICSS